jgi:hypothetical protein
MFGFGIGKLIVLAAIVAAVWYGYKFVNRLDQKRKREAAESKSQNTETIDKMVKCSSCGTYAVDTGAAQCGECGSPY